MGKCGLDWSTQAQDAEGEDVGAIIRGQCNSASAHGREKGACGSLHDMDVRRDSTSFFIARTVESVEEDYDYKLMDYTSDGLNRMELWLQNYTNTSNSLRFQCSLEKVRTRNTILTIYVRPSISPHSYLKPSTQQQWCSPSQSPD